MELELNTDTLSLGQRLSRIFTSPSRVFVDLQRNHSWLAALLIISSISLVAALPLLSKMREFSIMQLQRMPDNPALSSPEAINLVGTTAVIGTIAGALLMPLLFALIVYLSCLTLLPEIRYSTASCLRSVSMPTYPCCYLA